MTEMHGSSLFCTDLFAVLRISRSPDIHLVLTASAPVLHLYKVMLKRRRKRMRISHQFLKFQFRAPLFTLRQVLFWRLLGRRNIFKKDTLKLNPGGMSTLGFPHLYHMGPLTDHTGIHEWHTTISSLGYPTSIRLVSIYH